MAIDFNSFIDFAKNCLNSNDEFDHRNSASRAYYGALHHATPGTSHCPDNSNLVYGTHARITARYEAFNRDHHLWAAARSVSYSLKQLKGVRVKADYELWDSFSKNEAEAQFNSALLTIERVNSFVLLATSEAA